MAIKKKIKLNNGAEINYLVINNVVVMSNQQIQLEIHGFKSEEIYNEAVKKVNKIKEQEELIAKFNDLISQENYSEDESVKISNQINSIANEIASLKNYEDYILKRFNVTIDYIENYTTSELEKKVLKLKDLN